MSFINYSSREINCKIVYYGPGLAGKTAILRHIHDASDPAVVGKLIAVEDKEKRSMFFDFLPMDLGDLNNFKTRLHLYTVPGQVSHESLRKFILKGVDGIVFVVDSQRERMDANKQALQKLEEYLDDHGYDIKTVPMVFVYNKRDLKNIFSIEELRANLNKNSRPDFEIEAVNGRGVFDSLRAISKLVLDELKSGGTC